MRTIFLNPRYILDVLGSPVIYGVNVLNFTVLRVYKQLSRAGKILNFWVAGRRIWVPFAVLMLFTFIGDY